MTVFVGFSLYGSPSGFEVLLVIISIAQPLRGSTGDLSSSHP